jgi:hypothetical protein
MISLEEMMSEPRKGHSHSKHPEKINYEYGDLIDHDSDSRVAEELSRQSWFDERNDGSKIAFLNSVQSSIDEHAEDVQGGRPEALGIRTGDQISRVLLFKNSYSSIFRSPRSSIMPSPSSTRRIRLPSNGSSISNP